MENVDAMSDIERIQLFESKKIRTVWVEKEEKWYFAIEDVVEALTESRDPKQYVKRMKLRDPELAKGWVQIVPLLTIMTEGGPQKMRCANLEGMFRIIQSIPSKKAEPIKVWMGQTASQRSCGAFLLAWAFRQKIVSLRGEEENVKLYGGARVTSGHSLCHPLRVRNGAEHRGGALSAAAAQQCHCAGGDASLTPAPVGGGPYGGERGQPHFLATVLQSSYG